MNSAWPCVEFEHRDQSIRIYGPANANRIEVGAVILRPVRIVDGAEYVCDELPYQVFPSLRELAIVYADSILPGPVAVAARSGSADDSRGRAADLPSVLPGCC